MSESASLSRLFHVCKGHYLVTGAYHKIFESGYTGPWWKANSCLAVGAGQFSLRASTRSSNQQHLDLRASLPDWHLMTMRNTPVHNFLQSWGLHNHEFKLPYADWHMQNDYLPVGQLFFNMQYMSKLISYLSELG